MSDKKKKLKREKKRKQSIARRERPLPLFSLILHKYPFFQCRSNVAPQTIDL